MGTFLLCKAALIATQATSEDDLTRLAVFANGPSAQASQELHFRPFEGNAQVMEDGGGHPAQSHQGANTTQIEELDF